MSEFLWGYEEELACLDTLDENESDYDPFSSFGDDFFTEDEEKHDYELLDNNEIYKRITRVLKSIKISK